MLHPLAVHVITVAVVSFKKFTQEQLEAAPPLEPTFDALLRNANLHEDILAGFRVSGIMEVFVAIDDTRRGAFGVDPHSPRPSGRVPHKVDISKFLKARRQGNICAEPKTRVDAVARAHGVPVSILPCDWNSILAIFGRNFWVDICESKLPAQSHYEAFEEKLLNGSTEAEGRSHVISVEEEKSQKAV